MAVSQAPLSTSASFNNDLSPHTGTHDETLATDESGMGRTSREGTQMVEMPIVKVSSSIRMQDKVETFAKDNRPTHATAP